MSRFRYLCALGLVCLALSLVPPPSYGEGAEFLRFPDGSGLTLNYSASGLAVQAVVSVNSGDWLRQGPDGEVIVHLAANDADVTVNGAGSTLAGTGILSFKGSFDCAVFDPDNGVISGCVGNGNRLNLSLHATVEDGADAWLLVSRVLQKDGEFHKNFAEMDPLD